MFVLLVNSKRHFDNTAEKLKRLHDCVNSNLHMDVRNILQPNHPHPHPPAPKNLAKAKTKLNGTTTDLYFNMNNQIYRIMLNLIRKKRTHIYRIG